MAEQTENIVGMRKKIKAQAEHVRRLEQRIRELRQAAQQPEQSGLEVALEQFADDSNWCYDTCNISRDVAKDALASYRSTQGGDA